MSVPADANLQCPHCHGKGGTNAFVNRGPDISTHSVDWIKCRTCDGAGVVSGDTALLVARGEELRKARVARGESLMEASKRLGMSPAELSAIEHGRSSAALSKLSN